MRLIKEYIKLLLSEAPKNRKSFTRKLRVFDFDDTLVKTGSMVHVTNTSGDKFDLSPGEYAVYSPQPGDQFDYSDFDKLIDPQVIVWTAKILRNISAKGGEVVILTARGRPEPVQEFLKKANLPPLTVVALGDANPQKKADYIRRRIEADDLQHVEFFDDSYKNIVAVEGLKSTFPDVDIITRHIKH